MSLVIVDPEIRLPNMIQNEFNYRVMRRAGYAILDIFDQSVRVCENNPFRDVEGLSNLNGFKDNA